MDRLKASMANGQPQSLDGSNPLNGLPQQTQIIQIPPIDLSGQNQNIILVSGTSLSEIVTSIILLFRHRECNTAQRKWLPLGGNYDDTAAAALNKFRF